MNIIGSEENKLIQTTNTDDINTDNTDEKALENILIKDMYSAIELLDDFEKAIIALLYFENKTQREAAYILSLIHICNSYCRKT